MSDKFNKRKVKLRKDEEGVDVMYGDWYICRICEDGIGKYRSIRRDEVPMKLSKEGGYAKVFKMD